MGAWIEIFMVVAIASIALSLPLWERGLKSEAKENKAWEIGSLPLWERGLKFTHVVKVSVCCLVAPFVGAWIEIIQRVYILLGFYGRSLCGSVD